MPYKMRVNHIFIMSMACFLCGCRTMSADKLSQSKNKEAESALISIAEAVGGKELSKEELKNLKSRINSDEETKEAVTAITNSFTSGKKVKYCPVCGKRYAPHLKVCPEHNVELEFL